METMGAATQIVPTIRKWLRPGKVTLQYWVVAQFAHSGKITSHLLCNYGADSWRHQRSAGQRIRDCRRLGMRVTCGPDPDPLHPNGTVWSVDAASRELARKIVAQADREAAGGAA